MSNSFDDWWNAIEGYGLRSERCFDDLTLYDDSLEYNIRLWMKACWNAALDAAEELQSTSFESIRVK